MRGRKRIFLLATMAILLLSGCSESNQSESATGKGSIRALHAISNLGTINFAIEETTLGSLSFQGATGISEFDDLEYIFNFEIWLPDDTEEPTELVSRTLKVTSEQEYTFVLSGSLESPQLYLWEQFGRDWAEEISTAAENETEITVMEVSFGHISPALGTVDIYLEDPGTSPQAAVPKATLNYSEFESAIELAVGDYQLVVTPAGDPNTYLFASDPFYISAATSTLVTLIDDGGYTTAEFSVRLIGLGAELTNINSSAIISAGHSALGTGPLDLFDSADFGSPLIEDLGFGVISPEIEVDVGFLNMVVTPANNLGVFLSQNNLNVLAGTYNRLFFVGLPGALQTVFQRYDHSTVATHARLQLFQGAVRFPTVDIYVVDQSVDIQLIGPSYVSVLYGAGFSYTNREAGIYNVYVTEPGTKNIIAGPLQVDLEKSNNYSLIVVDSPNLSAAELLFFQDTTF